MFKKDKVLHQKSEITEHDGKTVLAKTDYFLLYIITKNDAIIGTILLTEAQAAVLNDTCKPHGIEFKRKLA